MQEIQSLQNKVNKVKKVFNLQRTKLKKKIRWDTQRKN